MLYHQLLHPEIQQALAQAGHGALVLIADGNYPASTAKGPAASLVSLNLRPGLLTVSQVLHPLLAGCPFEAAYTMDYARSGPHALTSEPPVWADFRAAFEAAGQGLSLSPIERFTFYETVRSADHALTIQTADQALYANLLLRVGVRQA
jgi:L-fucose mutarotase